MNNIETKFGWNKDIDMLSEAYKKVYAEAARIKQPLPQEVLSMDSNDFIKTFFTKEISSHRNRNPELRSIIGSISGVGKGVTIGERLKTLPNSKIITDLVSRKIRDTVREYFTTTDDPDMDLNIDMESELENYGVELDFPTVDDQKEAMADLVMSLPIDEVYEYFKLIKQSKGSNTSRLFRI